MSAKPARIRLESPNRRSRSGIFARPRFLKQALCKNDLDYSGHSFDPSPVPLQLACERNPRDRDATRLDNAVETGTMRFE
jgi:hypothetical protein